MSAARFRHPAVPERIVFASGNTTHLEDEIVAGTYRFPFALETPSWLPPTFPSVGRHPAYLQRSYRRRLRGRPGGLVEIALDSTGLVVGEPPRTGA